MAWFDFLRSPFGKPVEKLEIPLFPLRTVLFPGGCQPLKVFEQRYLDMCAASMKDSTPFGICLIKSGKEVGEVAVPHEIGTLATIGTWDMEQLGILTVTVQGTRRFRILETRATPDHLLIATVELLADNEALPLPAERQRLVPLLRQIVNDVGSTRIPEPHHFEDAAWVGYRITEVLPIQHLAKQKLLELEDPIARLEILERYLDQRKLLG